jgi:hypothetical protein
MNGDRGHGGNTTTLKTLQFINPAAFLTTASTAAAPLFSNAPRTAPYNLYGPANYDIDISLRRSFGLHFEGPHLLLQADLYNLTNHTQFGGIGTVFGVQPSERSAHKRTTRGMLSSPHVLSSNFQSMRAESNHTALSPRKSYKRKLPATAAFSFASTVLPAP